jgi:hypothetical protein
VKLWIVINISSAGDAFEFCGVYSSRDAAESHCHSPSYMVGPCELDIAPPELSEPWPDAYYPLASDS